MQILLDLDGVITDMEIELLRDIEFELVVIRTAIIFIGSFYIIAKGFKL